ncbi:MAG: glycosyltransferase [Tannerella sp.]|jgi:glycosyltransferase involved in cell wall biosynthesis|nr:glycosyltransferase [Tannerella sp.]
MLSICIPVYNYFVADLVQSLHDEAETLNIPYEILLSDNASEEKYRVANSLLGNLSNVNYRQSAINLERAGNRNFLFKTAKFPYILFMDCDSKVSKPNYIKDFLPYCVPGGICSGGRLYEPFNPQYKDAVLHWKVGVARESWPASVRSEKPNHRFMSCNFLIDKKIFDTVKFDERLTGYCNEDTLFGIELQKEGIVISHIDNPLYHTGLEKAEVFMSKIEEGLRNYHKINYLYHNDPQFISSVKILRVEQKLKKWHLLNVCKTLFKMSRKLMYRNLMSLHPNLKVYDLYKLGYLCYSKDFEIK